MICTVCNEEMNKSYLKCTKICQSCYKYTHSGGKIYDLPEVGEVVRNKEDKPICHICGQAHSKLGSHIFYKHKITTREYQDKFGLPHSTKLTSSNYRCMMRIYNNNYRDLVVVKNLVNGGTDTRFDKANNISVGNHKKHVRIKNIDE